MVAQILIRKLLYMYLHRLLTTQFDNIAARILTTCIDSTEIAIVQQHHFLEGLFHIKDQEGMSLTEKGMRNLRMILSR